MNIGTITRFITGKKMDIWDKGSGVKKEKDLNLVVRPTMLLPAKKILFFGEGGGEGQLPSKQIYRNVVFKGIVFYNLEKPFFYGTQTLIFYGKFTAKYDKQLLFFL